MIGLRVGVLISGRGSNLKALIDAAAEPEYPARIVVVCANRLAPGLDHARRAAIPTAVLLREDYPSREARDLALAQELEAHAIDLIVCAGYDAILAPAFVRRFSGRILNLHPSLLPAFAGCMDAPARALRAGVTETGCTVHLVTDDVDGGPILAQRKVPVEPGDSPEHLHARIQVEEHRLLPEVVRRLAAEPLPLSP